MTYIEPDAFTKIEKAVVIALLFVVVLMGGFFLTSTREVAKQAFLEVPSADEYCLDKGGVSATITRPQTLMIIYCANGDHTHKETKDKP